MEAKDAFSRCHPAVNFLFFAGAIGFGVVFQHPAYLLLSAACGLWYYFLLHGRKGKTLLLGLLPVLVLIAVLNPVFNTRGATELFRLFGRPYTLESLLAGAAVSGVFLVTMVWFGCYSAVMTGDKVTSLFGSLIPSLSLLLVMIFRLVPELFRKAGQISAARRSLGRGMGEKSRFRDKAQEALTILGTLTAWSLEGSVVTADSMRSRGYGTGKRSSFRVHSITRRDVVLFIAMGVLIAVVIVFAALGSVNAQFLPKIKIASVRSWRSVGLLGYGIYLLLPVIVQGEENVRWRNSKLKT